MLLDQLGQVGDGADDGDVAVPLVRVRVVLHIRHGLDAGPRGHPQGAGGAAGQPAGADDQRVTLVDALRPQPADGEPRQAAGTQHAHESEQGEQGERDPRLVLVPQGEGHQCRQKGGEDGPFGHGHGLLAEAGEAVDFVHAGVPAADHPEDDDERQPADAQGEIGAVVVEEGNPIRLEPQPVGEEPRGDQCRDIEHEKPQAERV